ncbi:mas-related G-protein coupled receptor member X1-like [Dromiciops gliroides]|uniref:mas-related G-protein coupled receptor member X1-like n=1 Tax=Dromiciops gliroides TaxID=33562 RepID=UPI001CC6D7B7|nr:mas-related G-protein coupled receptor member X1-like [Dromiciops gliroides]
MAVSPTPGELEYVNNYTSESRANGSYVGREFFSGNWMEILSLVIALAGLVGNSTVLWLLGFRIPRNPFSVYILNLAGADALFLCCSFLISIDRFVDYLGYSFKYYVAVCTKYCFYVVGLSLLAAISTERCLSVLFPIWYKCHRPKHMSAAVCAVLWALPVLFWVAGAIVYVRIKHQYFLDFLFITEFMWFVLLTCVLCVSSLTLLLRVQCSFQRQHPPRLYLLVLLTVLMFLVCGLPLEIGFFIEYLSRISMHYWFAHLMAYVNSSVNPIIYFFLGRQRHRRRESLRVILQRALGEEQELGGGIRDNPHTNSPETSF